MSHEIRVPRLGWSMEEGKFLGWLKKPGEVVRVGEPLFELESDKAAQQIESVDAGTLQIPPDSPVPDSVVPVGLLLGYLVPVGESFAGTGSPQINDPPTAAQSVASPRARRVAAEIGVDWTGLKGTGRDGRIREADVLAGAKKSDAIPPRSSPSPMSPRRQAIAERLRRSRDRTVPVTLTTTADATNLVALREQFKAAKMAVIPAYTDVLACLVTRVLKLHLHVAVNWDRDQLGLIQIEHPYGIGIAVDTPDGLLVPVVRDAASKPLMTVAQESKALIDRARAGRLSTVEMQGGVITISNLGAWGIDAFTPIINYPEIAILGLGAIRRELVVLADDRTVSRERVVLSLTFDHAAIDGAPAAAFLRDVVQAVENPAPYLMG